MQFRQIPGHRCAWGLKPAARMVDNRIACALKQTCHDRLRAVLIALCVLASSARYPAQAQTSPRNYIELRAAGSENGFYRYAEYGRMFGGSWMADVLYFGNPGQNELWAGIGYQVNRVPKTTLTVLAYGVLGKENREAGAAFGLVGYSAIGEWTASGFLGHFIRVRGDVPNYTFLDCFDLTRTIRGNLSVGASTGFFHISSSTTYLAGPLVTYADSRGTWRLYARGGSYFEGRLSRVVSF